MLSADDALKAARAVLSRRSFPRMAESYHIIQGNAMTVTFCAMEKDAVCYPDMVKVTVAMDNGELLRYDAEGYLTCHAKRELPAPVMTPEEAVERLMQGRTTIMVAHRLSTIQRADCIMVMHHGRIRERGTHQELLEQGGIYKKLYELQLSEH